MAGGGIVQLPTFLARDDLRAGRLLPLLEDWRTPSLAVYTIYPSRRYLPGKVRAFVDFLAEAWRGQPAWEDWRPAGDYSA